MNTEKQEKARHRRRGKLVKHVFGSNELTVAAKQLPPPSINNNNNINTDLNNQGKTKAGFRTGREGKDKPSSSVDREAAN